MSEVKTKHKGAHKRTRSLEVTHRLVEKQTKVDRDRRRRMGQIIKALREREGMTQIEMAKAVGQEYFTFISQVETGQSKIPSRDIAIWARALAVQAEDLAKECLKHYDPLLFETLFPGEDPDDVDPGLNLVP